MIIEYLILKIQVSTLEARIAALETPPPPPTTAIGGNLVLKSDNSSTSKAILPNVCIVLKLKNYSGSIVVWQITTSNSPIWTDIPNSVGLIEMTVCYPTITTFYRVKTISPINAQSTAYSSSFKLSQSA